MCHFLRMYPGGNAVLHTHFWFGCTFDGKSRKLLLSKTMNYKAMLYGLSEHCVREFANLAKVLPKIYALEGKKILAEGADCNYYCKGKHPNIW